MEAEIKRIVRNNMYHVFTVNISKYIAGNIAICIMILYNNLKKN